MTSEEAAEVREAFKDISDEVDVLIAQQRTLQEDHDRYRSALQTIVSVLEPLHSPHTTECVGTCRGCLYEWEEALIVAMNVLAGIDESAHLGDWYDKHGNLVSKAKYTKEQRYQAWRDFGFEQDPDDPSIWSRGHAF